MFFTKRTHFQEPLRQVLETAAEQLPVYEELRIVPSQPSQEQRSTGFVEPEVLVLSPNPGLQLLID